MDDHQAYGAGYTNEISVVIPLYNKGKYVARALNSVLSQTFQHFEIIIVDDGSTDNGRDVVKEFPDPRIHLIRQEHQGVSAARNRGVEKAEADLIAFLDADDEWSRSHLETLYNLSDKYPDCQLFSTGFIRITNGVQQKRIPIIGIPEPPWEGNVDNFFLIARVGPYLINSSTAAVRKDALVGVGGFPVGVRQYEDEVVWGNMALKSPIAFSYGGDAYVHYNTEGSASGQLLPIREHPFIEYAKRALITGELPSPVEQELQKYIQTLYVRSACRNIQCRNVGYAVSNLRSCGWSIFKPDHIREIVYSVSLLIWPR